MKLKIGVLILFISFIVGWGGAAVCGALFVNTGDESWIKLAGILYAASWVLFSISIVVGGKEAYSRFKQIFSKKK
jgi:hypothetical protein